MPVSPSPPPAFCPALLPNAGLTNQQWPRAPHRILGFRPTEVMLPKAGFCEPLRSHGQLETGAAHLARALTGGCSYGHLITSFYFLIPKLLHMCTVGLSEFEREFQEREERAAVLLTFVGSCYRIQLSESRPIFFKQL